MMAIPLRRWLKHLTVAPLDLEPGSPWEKGDIEPNNGTMWAPCLTGELFYTLKDAQILTARWRTHDNTVRPHSRLGGQTPAPDKIQFAS